MLCNPSVAFPQVEMHHIRKVKDVRGKIRTGDSTYAQWVGCYNQCLLYTAWTRVKDNDNMIGCATNVSVSTSCSRCDVLTSTSCTMTHLHHILWTLSSWASSIYRVDTILYPYALPIASTLISFSSFCLSYNLSQA